MRTKITIIFLLAISAQLIISCCDCPDLTKFQYKFEYATVFNLDNSGATPVISESPISKNAYGIKLQLGLRQLSSNGRKHFSLFNQAYAMCCFCGPDTVISLRDTISSLKITTINSFDNNHPKGSDVTDLFRVLKHNTYITIDSVIAQPAIYYKRTETEFLEMYLFTPPNEPGEHSFQVDITLSNNTHMLATTKSIELK